MHLPVAPSPGRPRIAASIIAFTLTASLASGASAQSTNDRAIAETLFREGKSLIEAKKVSEACAKFVESQRLDPRLGTLLHIATCHELEGKTASAWIEFTEAATLAARARQTDRERLARERAKSLEQQLSRIVVTVTAPAPDERVFLDNGALAEGSFGTSLPVDPGEHELRAEAPSKATWSKKITVARGPTSEAIVVPALEDPPRPIAPPPPPQVVTRPPPPPAEGPNTRRLIAYGLFAGGAIGLGLGTVFGLRAASSESDADALCPTKSCPTQEGLDKHDEASSAATVSTIAFAVGILAAGAGTYFFLTSHKSTATSTSVALTPRLSPTEGGFDARVRF